MSIEANFPAYPVSELRTGNGEIYQSSSPGLTKRELFAAMAMQSLIAKTPAQELLLTDPGTLPMMCARGAVDYADALLKELTK